MATFIESPRVQVVLFLVCSLLIGCTDKEGIVEAEPEAWEETSFPGELYGNWYSDFDGSWQWGISGSTRI